MQPPFVKEMRQSQIYHHTTKIHKLFQVTQTLVESVTVDLNCGYHQVDNAVDAHLSRLYGVPPGAHEELLRCSWDVGITIARGRTDSS
jgi:hypothetical protein